MDAVLFPLLVGDDKRVRGVLYRLVNLPVCRPYIGHNPVIDEKLLVVPDIADNRFHFASPYG
jgi:hypothetical protein